MAEDAAGQWHWEECPETINISKGELDMTGFRVGKLSVVGKLARQKNERIRWLMKCDCGQYESRYTRDLVNPLNFADHCNKCTCPVV